MVFEFRTKKSRTEDLRGGAFSIRLFDPLFVDEKWTNQRMKSNSDRDLNYSPRRVGYVSDTKLLIFLHVMFENALCYEIGCLIFRELFWGR